MLFWSLHVWFKNSLKRDGDTSFCWNELCKHSDSKVSGNITTWWSPFSLQSFSSEPENWLVVLVHLKNSQIHLTISQLVEYRILMEVRGLLSTWSALANGHYGWPWFSTSMYQFSFRGKEEKEKEETPEYHAENTVHFWQAEQFYFLASPTYNPEPTAPVLSHPWTEKCSQWMPALCSPWTAQRGCADSWSVFTSTLSLVLENRT